MTVVPPSKWSEVNPSDSYLAAVVLLSLIPSVTLIDAAISICKYETQQSYLAISQPGLITGKLDYGFWFLAKS